MGSVDTVAVDPAHAPVHIPFRHVFRPILNVTVFHALWCQGYRLRPVAKGVHCTAVLLCWQRALGRNATIWWAAGCCVISALPRRRSFALGPPGRATDCIHSQRPSCKLTTAFQERLQRTVFRCLGA